MNVFNEIRHRYDTFSKTYKKISDYILSHALEVQNSTAIELAERCETSSASIIRYVKQLGYKGLDDFKIELAKTISISENYGGKIDLIISKEDGIDILCNKIHMMTTMAHAELFRILDQSELKKAIEKTNSAKRIYLLGIGASASAALDLYHKLNRIGHTAVYTQDNHMTAEFLNYASKEDVVIAISYSGESKEVVYGAEIAKKKGACIISITRAKETSLSALTDVLLTVPNTEHVMRAGAITSLQTTLTICFVLFLGVLQINYEENEIRLVETRKLVNRMKVKE